MPSSSSRYPEHAPPASCQDGDLPRTVNLMGGAYPARSEHSAVRMRKGVRGGGALGAEDEGQLALGLEAALGQAKRGARLVEVERAEHVLLEVAVLAADGLRLRHRGHGYRAATPGPPTNPQNGAFSYRCNLQGIRGHARS